VALRYGSPKDRELLARRVTTITFGLYTSASYREKLNDGQSPVLIGFDQESDFIAEAKWLTRQFGNQRFSFRTNSQTTQAAAARAGFGVALLPRYIVATHEPELVEVFLGDRLPQRDVWLLVRRDLKNVPRVTALSDYLFRRWTRGRKYGLRGCIEVRRRSGAPIPA